MRSLPLLFIVLLSSNALAQNTAPTPAPTPKPSPTPTPAGTPLVSPATFSTCAVPNKPSGVAWTQPRSLDRKGL